MIRHFFTSADTPLVPLADRLRYMQAFRVAAAAAAMLSWLLLPATRGMPLSALAAATAGYLAVTLFSLVIWRLPRRAAVWLFGLTLLVDGVYLAAVSYTPAGLLSPLRYLVLAHLITVTLLASFRTGLKLALWHSLLLSLEYQLRQAGTLTDVAAVGADRLDTTAQLVVFVMLAWMVAFATASFAAVNERELRRRGYDLEALARLAWRLESTTVPNDVGRALVESVGEDFDLPLVVLLAGDDEPLKLLAKTGGSGDPVAYQPDSDDAVAAAIRDRSTVLLALPHARRDPWLSRALPDARNVGLVPLTADGRVVGVLVFEYGMRRGSRIEHRVVTMIERFASQAALALVNAWLMTRIHDLATTDELTGVANRRVFVTQLARRTTRSRIAGSPLSVVLLDIDHFKSVNDTHGHAVGDDVLRTVAETLRAGCRPGDLLARYGGEEFALLLPETGADEAISLADRLRRRVARATGPVQVTASLGVATLSPTVATPDELIAAADLAMYESKRGGRNRITHSTRAPGLAADPRAGGKPAA